MRPVDVVRLDVDREGRVGELVLEGQIVRPIERDRDAAERDRSPVAGGMRDLLYVEGETLRVSKDESSLSYETACSTPLPSRPVRLTTPGGVMQNVEFAKSCMVPWRPLTLQSAPRRGRAKKLSTTSCLILTWW